MNLVHKGLLAKLNMLLEKRKADHGRSCIQEDHIKYGGTCLFVALTKKWGAKLYYDKDTRDQCHALQLKAYQKMLAPRVGAKFETDKDTKRFGHLTEIVETPFVVNEQWPKVREVSNVLHERMFRRGLTTGDLHGWNIGKIDERYVCIDFDNVFVVDPSVAVATRDVGNYPKIGVKQPDYYR